MSVRKKFVSLLHEEMKINDKIVLVLGDLGYGHFDKIREEFPNRVFNPGAAEQLMLGMACGMAMEGLIPVCYSMTPFILYRPFEVIRTFIDHEKNSGNPSSCWPRQRLCIRRVVSLGN